MADFIVQFSGMAEITSDTRSWGELPNLARIVTFRHDNEAALSMFESYAFERRGDELLLAGIYGKTGVLKRVAADGTVIHENAQTAKNLRAMFPKNAWRLGRPTELRTWATPRAAAVALVLTLAILVPQFMAALLAVPLFIGMTAQGWVETINATIADTASTAVSTEQTAFAAFTFPASYMTPHKSVRLTLWGNISSAVTTPGTAIVRVKWGATVLGANAAFTPKTTVSTNLPFRVEAMLTCRTEGATGTFATAGMVWFGNYDPALTTAIGDSQQPIPASGTEVVTVDTTAATAIAVTIQFSVTTAAFTIQQGVIEALS